MTYTRCPLCGGPLMTILTMKNYPTYYHECTVCRWVAEEDTSTDPFRCITCPNNAEGLKCDCKGDKND